MESMSQEDKKSNGALVGSIIIIIILVVGGIYVWQSKVKKATDSNYKEEATTTLDDAELNTLEEEAGGLDSEIDLDINSVN